MEPAPTGSAALGIYCQANMAQVTHPGSHELVPNENFVPNGKFVANGFGFVANGFGFVANGIGNEICSTI